MDHDHSYKLLFSHPEMVADLLRGFVHDDWVKDLDFASLERVGDGYVTDTCANGWTTSFGGCGLGRNGSTSIC